MPVLPQSNLKTVIIASQGNFRSTGWLALLEMPSAVPLKIPLKIFEFNMSQLFKNVDFFFFAVAYCIGKVGQVLVVL